MYACEIKRESSAKRATHTHNRRSLFTRSVARGGGEVGPVLASRSDEEAGQVH